MKKKQKFKISQKKKLPVTWSSKISSRYKHNAIMSELQRAKRIAKHFNF